MQFTDFKVTLHDNPANVMMRLEKLAESLTKSGLAMPESQVYARFASLCPPEYERQNENFCEKTELSREEILRGVCDKYSAIRASRPKAEPVHQEAASGKKKSGGK